MSGEFSSSFPSQYHLQGKKYYQCKQLETRMTVFEVFLMINGWVLAWRFWQSTAGKCWMNSHRNKIFMIFIISNTANNRAPFFAVCKHSNKLVHVSDSSTYFSWCTDFSSRVEELWIWNAISPALNFSWGTFRSVLWLKM